MDCDWWLCSKTGYGVLDKMTNTAAAHNVPQENKPQKKSAWNRCTPCGGAHPQTTQPHVVSVWLCKDTEAW